MSMREISNVEEFNWEQASLPMKGVHASHFQSDEGQEGSDGVLTGDFLPAMLKEKALRDRYHPTYPYACQREDSRSTTFGGGRQTASVLELWERSSTI